MPTLSLATHLVPAENLGALRTLSFTTTGVYAPGPGVVLMTLGSSLSLSPMVFLSEVALGSRGLYSHGPGRKALSPKPLKRADLPKQHLAAVLSAADVSTYSPGPGTGSGAFSALAAKLMLQPFRLPEMELCTS